MDKTIDNGSWSMTLNIKFCILLKIFQWKVHKIEDVCFYQTNICRKYQVNVYWNITLIKIMRENLLIDRWILVGKAFSTSVNVRSKESCRFQCWNSTRSNNQITIDKFNKSQIDSTWLRLVVAWLSLQSDELKQDLTEQGEYTNETNQRSENERHTIDRQRK